LWKEGRIFQNQKQKTCTACHWGIPDRDDSEKRCFGEVILKFCSSGNSGVLSGIAVFPLRQNNLFRAYRQDISFQRPQCTTQAQNGFQEKY
jgi:hypothetical protein